jgi:hypothetical protein
MDVAGEREVRFPSMLGAGTAAAAPDAIRAVTNWRRSKVICFPRKTKIAVRGQCARILTTEPGNRSFYYFVWAKNDQNHD